MFSTPEEQISTREELLNLPQRKARGMNEGT